MAGKFQFQSLVADKIKINRNLFAKMTRDLKERYRKYHSEFVKFKAKNTPTKASWDLVHTGSPRELDEARQRLSDTVKTIYQAAASLAREVGVQEQRIYDKKLTKQKMVEGILSELAHLPELDANLIRSYASMMDFHTLSRGEPWSYDIDSMQNKLDRAHEANRSKLRPHVAKLLGLSSELENAIDFDEAHGGHYDRYSIKRPASGW